MSTLSRRQLLKIGMGAGGALVLGFYLPLANRQAAVRAAEDQAYAPNAFIRVHPDNRITFISPNVEMGQGVYTSHAMIVAEEMDADFSTFNSVAAPVNEAYNNPLFGMMGTGGSTSTPAFWEPLRQAGAGARAVFLAAAAARWDVAPEALSVSGSVISHEASGRRANFGELITEAAQQQPPAEPELKDPADFRLIGQSTRRIEGPDKVRGEATFGIDLQLPDMLTATIARPPVIGGKPLAVENQAEVEAMPGVRKVKLIDRGVAVLADTYWQAKKGRDRLQVRWDDGPNAELDTEQLYQRYRQLSETAGLTAESTGELPSDFDTDDAVTRGVFELPYLAHAPMEPLNATAHVRENEAEVWAGTYLQTNDRALVAQALGLEPDQVQIHTLLMGGAFGRRATPDADFIMDAVKVARGEGVPVKTLWAREDDIQGGRYRPLAVHRIEARLGDDGLPRDWRQRIVVQSILTGTPFEPFLVHDGIDEVSVEGAKGMPYAIPNRQIELHSPEVPVSTLWWRSVGHTHTAYANEHFLDLLAQKAGQDPVEYRRQLLKDNEDPRFLGVLNLVAEKAGWGNPLPAGRVQGVALRKSFNSYVAEVVEMSLDDEGRPKVHRVVAAVDVGTPINPWNIEAQVQSGVAYALTSVLHGDISIRKGRVQQSNFHDYQALRMHEMPPVEVHIVPSQASPTGIGEPGVPPLAPAFANALLALTGKPVWRLPVGHRDFRTVEENTSNA